VSQIPHKESIALVLFSGDVYEELTGDFV